MRFAGLPALQWGGFYKTWRIGDLSKSSLKFGLAAICGSSSPNPVGHLTRTEAIAQHPANGTLIRYFANKLLRSSIEMFDPSFALADYYLWAGSHPEIVERVWDQLGADRREGRCLMAGTPALADPASGIVLACALGTTYIVRVPLGAEEEATQLGYRSTHEFLRKAMLDLTIAIEPGWVFGRWLDFECDWLRLVIAQARPGDLPGAEGPG